jgi:hypothetical protein
LRLYYSAALEVGGDARPLTTVARPLVEAHRTNSAINTAHRGALIALGDYEILWNMTPTSGLRSGQNSEFVMRAFEVLSNGSERRVRARGPRGPKRTGIPGSFRSVPGRASILFSSRGSALLPDASPSGLLEFARKMNRAGYNVTLETTRGQDVFYV